MHICRASYFYKELRRLLDLNKDGDNEPEVYMPELPYLIITDIHTTIHMAREESVVYSIEGHRFVNINKILSQGDCLVVIDCMFRTACFDDDFYTPAICI